FTIQSPLASADVLTRLANATEKSRWIHWSHQHRLFQGVINGNRFDVRRIIHERNSSLPRIIGEIVPGAGGTSIVGSMLLAGWVRPFLLSWTGFVGLALVA